MTPVQVGSHAASAGRLIATNRFPTRTGARISARFMDAHQWSRILLVTDIVVLYLASSFALFADTPVRDVTTNRWLSAMFPLVVVGIMRARRSPDERLQASVLETMSYVLGVVSLSAMLTISVDSILSGSDPVGLAIRLWLFAVVYLGVARAMLVSVRRQAMRNPELATPTLIVGAGMIGTHIVKRLFSEPNYGLLSGRLPRRRPPARPRRRHRKSSAGARRPRRPGGGDRQHRRAPRHSRLLRRT